MKVFYSIMMLPLIISCIYNRTTSEKNERQIKAKEITKSEFQKIIDSSNVKGSILIYDLLDNKYYSNDFEWAKKGKLPASTFKIPNSIIALETGLVENDSTLFIWNGEKRMLKNWEQDLSLKNAFHFSCVPCYQDIARNIGTQRMNDYLLKLDYGNMQVDSTNIDEFWLKGESKINQLQQIEFLKRFYKSELPISRHSETIMKRMMIIEQGKEGKLSGKTGWSIRNEKNNGWFVGYLETALKIYFFATNIEPKKDLDMDKFLLARKEVTLKALEKLKKENTDSNATK